MGRNVGVGTMVIVKLEADGPPFDFAQYKQTRSYFSCFSSTTITSIGLVLVFTSACMVLGGFAGSQ
jgi:hypothetical protein